VHRVIELGRSDAWEVVATLDECASALVLTGLLTLVLLAEDAIAVLVGRLLPEAGG
jgi:hypothetical protein